MDKSVYIIIVTYNGMRNGWIEKCLLSIANSIIKVNVFIIDNASTDNTVDFLLNNEFGFPLKVEKSKVNLGFGRANNVGIGRALNERADYIFLLNQDAYLYPETIGKLIEVHQKYPEYGILSPIHLNGNGTTLDRNFSVYISHDRNKSIYYDAIKGNMKHIYEVPFVNAAAWLLPRKTLEIIGGFDPMFFHYGEDDNYCQRVIYHGFRIGVVCNAEILHDREDRKKETCKTRRDEIKNKELLYKVIWGNINDDRFEGEFLTKKIKLKKQLFKNALILNINKYCLYLLELKMINTIYSQIIESKRINVETGMHYLK